MSQVFDYATDVPLFESRAAAADHGMAGIANPDERAIRAIHKVAARRGLETDR
ncbi:hypothetical protein [Mycolicibacterium mageritense]|uniref:hypothetical protein n=1 Tax=Mycolicibacterium mageritense TaxID=53462 RepID=UPI001E56E5F7|nr:hypothetical protein [Mycolicibacterium mageritense]MCC9181144.1 hypothetical protein [Mycolicibacterium mageritense]